MTSRNLHTPKTTDATVIVEIRDNDLLSQIKEDQLSEADKINKIHNLSQPVATKNGDSTCDLHSYNGSIAALKGNMSMSEAIEIMAAVEEKRGVNNMSLPKNMALHFSQVSSFDTPFQTKTPVKPEPKTALQENVEEMNLKTQKIKTQRGGTFNFNIN